jgi:hypothetical protein
MVYLAMSRPLAWVYELDIQYAGGLGSLGDDRVYGDSLAQIDSLVRDAKER